MSVSLLLTLPQGLLETLFAHPTLHARDLSSVHAACAAHPSAAHIHRALQAAALLRLRATPAGRLLLPHRFAHETALALLHFLHRQDGAVAPPPAATSIWSSGRNDAGQGARVSPHDTNTPLPTHRVASAHHEFARPPAPVIFVAAGQAHSACLTAYGTLQLAGCNRRGQLGLGDLSPRPAWTPARHLSTTRIAQVACGAEHTLVLTAAGRVLVAGANDAGQLGTADRVQRTRFCAPAPFASTPVAMIAAGTNHSVVLLENSTVFATGDNSNAQLGGRADGGAATFQPVGCFGRKVVRVACGSDTTMLLTADNMVLVTGKRKCGLSVIGGLGTSRVTHLSVGEGFAIASTDERAVAVSLCRKRFFVTDELNVVDAACVSAGISHYAIATEDGGVLASGANAFGQVAAGEMGLTIEGGMNARIIRPHRVPLSNVDIPPGYRVKHVAAGSFHTLFLLAADGHAQV